jgi:two-component system response regulator FixJ
MTSDPLVHVIDDDEAARDALAFLLSAEKFAVRPHASARAFLDVLPDSEAGCIVTDVRMPEINGLDLLRRLKSREIDWPVIVMTGQADVPVAVQAIKLGAVDFIEKPYEADVLLEAVRSALGGKGNKVRDLQRSEIKQRLASLLPLEGQVLEALIDGRLDNTIAQELGLSAHAVAVHRANMMSKMRAANLAHLVRLMLMTGP